MTTSNFASYDGVGDSPVALVLVGRSRRQKPSDVEPQEGGSALQVMFKDFDGAQRLFDCSEFAKCGKRTEADGFAFDVAHAASTMIRGRQMTRSWSARLPRHQKVWGEFANWLVLHRERFDSLLTLLKSGRNADDVTAKWQSCLNDWSADKASKAGWLLNGTPLSAKAPEKAALTVNDEISAVRQLATQLEQNGAAPAVRGPRSIARARGLAKPRPSLAEGSRQTYQPSTNLKQTYDEIDEAFSRSLTQHLGDRALDMNDSDLAKALSNLNNVRLDAVRASFETLFGGHLKRWNDGLFMVTNCDLSDAELIKRCERSTSYGTTHRAVGLHHITRLDDVNSEAEFKIAWARYLKLLQLSWSGHLFLSGARLQIHARIIAGLVREHPEYFRVASYSTDERLPWDAIRSITQSYFQPQGELVVALFMMMLCDTGANQAVGLAMPWREEELFEPSNLPGHVRFASPKLRAGGALIYGDLPMKPIKGTGHAFSLYQAFNIFRKMTAQFRSPANRGSEDRFFIYPHRDNGWCALELCDPKTVLSVVETIRQKISAFDGFDITPSMIRSSVLLRSRLAADGSLAIAQIRAGHKKRGQTQWYVDTKTPTRLTLEIRMRGFLETFEYAVVQTIDGVAKKLGISAKKAAALVKKAQRTGLGPLCTNALAGEQPGTRKGELCTRLGCPDCRLAIVVAIPESIADLLMLRDVLWNEAQSGTFPKMHPERWEKFWLPWLAFCEAAVECMQFGNLRIVLKEAETIAASRKEAAVVLPPLW